MDQKEPAFSIASNIVADVPLGEWLGRDSIFDAPGADLEQRICGVQQLFKLIGCQQILAEQIAHDLIGLQGGSGTLFAGNIIRPLSTLIG